MSEYKVKQAEQGVENGINELERAMNELKGSWGHTAKSFQGFADSAGDLADRLGSQANIVAWGSVFLSGVIAGFLLSRRRANQMTLSSVSGPIGTTSGLDTTSRIHPPHGATGT